MKLDVPEFKNIKELKEYLKDKNEIPNDFNVAVIVFAFDNENRIVFQRRGPGCRDERLKLEAIGGGVKESDKDFITALNREIVEEVGENAKIEVEEFACLTYNKTFDKRYNKEMFWVYLTYKGKLISGEPKIAEPTKCLGYERHKIGEVDVNELSHGAREIYKIISEKYKYLK